MSNKNFKYANMDYLQDLAGGNMQLIKEIIQLFVQQTPPDMALLASYVDQEAWEQAYKQAHHIKPTLAYVGANEMRSELQEIETLAKNQQELNLVPTKLEALSQKLEILYEELKAYLQTLD